MRALMRLAEALINKYFCVHMQGVEKIKVNTKNTIQNNEAKHDWHNN